VKTAKRVTARITMETVRSHTTPVNGCWEWNGVTDDRRYGQVRIDGKARLAHRLVYASFCGEVPDGMLVAHRCNNKRCVNPKHLYLATPSQNMLDANRDGLILHVNTKKKCCPRCGSAYEIQRGFGWRYCRPCKVAWNRRAKAAKRAAARAARKGAEENGR
jgi:ribosomal protein L37AE/L43A